MLIVRSYIWILTTLLTVTHAFQIPFLFGNNGQKLVKAFPFDLNQEQRDALRLTDEDLKQLCKLTVADVVAQANGTSHVNTRLANITTTGLWSWLPQLHVEPQTDPSIAVEIFRNIRVDGNWHHAANQLDMLEECPGSIEHVRSFKFDPYLGHDNSTPPESLPGALLNILSTLKNTNSLLLNIPEWHTDIFASSFSSANLSLPAIQALTVGPFNEFAVTMCPKVQTVSTYSSSGSWLHAHREDALWNRTHSHRLIKAAAHAPCLTTFAMDERWTDSLVEAVVEELPNITNLSLRIEFDGPWRLGTGLTTAAPILSRHKNLKVLTLPGAFDLGVTDFQPPMCGNVYFGPGGDEFAAQVNQEYEDAKNIAADIVYKAMPWLEKLFIDAAEVQRPGSGIAG